MIDFSLGSILGQSSDPPSCTSNSSSVKMTANVALVGPHIFNRHSASRYSQACQIVLCKYKHPCQPSPKSLNSELGNLLSRSSILSDVLLGAGKSKCHGKEGHGTCRDAERRIARLKGQRESHVAL